MQNATRTQATAIKNDYLRRIHSTSLTDLLIMDAGPGLLIVGAWVPPQPKGVRDAALYFSTGEFVAFAKDIYSDSQVDASKALCDARLSQEDAPLQLLNAVAEHGATLTLGFKGGGFDHSQGLDAELVQDYDYDDVESGIKELKHSGYNTLLKLHIRAEGAKVVDVEWEQISEGGVPCKGPSESSVPRKCSWPSDV